MRFDNIWIALVLLGLGVCGILDATGLVESSRTIGQWWPLAVIGWPVTGMLAARRVTFAGVACAAIGLTLLADEQQWSSDLLVWSVLALFLGGAILAAAALEHARGGHPGGDSRAPVGGGAS